VTVLLGVSLLLGLGLLVTLLLAPLETLEWWAGWYDRSGKRHGSLPRLQPREVRKASHYLVFLDGIAKARRENYDEVQALLDRLLLGLPNAVIIGSVLPYSVTQRPLVRDRRLARYWHWVLRRKLARASDPLGFTINLYNLSQVLVSADRRYGPVFNWGCAQSILKALLERCYQPGSGVPVTLIGYSGGAQVAAGVTPYLKTILRAPVDLISLGGVMAADPGLKEVRRLYHLLGSKDRVARRAALVFPGRWRIFGTSSWNSVRQQGKLTWVPLGPMTHNAKGHYLDASSFLTNGKSCLEHTADTLLFILEQPERVRARRVRDRAYGYRFDLP
jgi:hypothetical protein